jgi:hypothetical protein
MFSTAWHGRSMPDSDQKLTPASTVACRDAPTVAHHPRLARPLRSLNVVRSGRIAALPRARLRRVCKFAHPQLRADFLSREVDLPTDRRPFAKCPGVAIGPRTDPERRWRESDPSGYLPIAEMAVKATNRAALLILWAWHAPQAERTGTRQGGESGAVPRGQMDKTARDCQDAAGGRLQHPEVKLRCAALVPRTGPAPRPGCALIFSLWNHHDLGVFLSHNQYNC